MKRLITLLSLLPLASLTYGQAITITAADAPIPTAAYDVFKYATGAIPNPTVGTAASWDYSTFSGITTIINYTTETDPFFTAAGANRQLEQQTKYLNGTLLYFYDSKIKFSSTGVEEVGINIPEQLYDISGLTGSMGDSLNIPAQRYIVSTPSKIKVYPMTIGTSWVTNGRRTTNFKLTVAAASLNNAPSSHVYYSYRKDTVVGWGKMKVYTPSGPSAQYDVLMAKIIEHSIDSFYIGGAPAPASLLSGFGITQGQQTDDANRYMFLIKGSFFYLASIAYLDDPSFTNAAALYVNKAVAPAGVGEVAGGSYATVLFPNPSTGNDVNMMISGAAVTADEYYITDMLGRVMQRGAVNMKQGVLHISLGTTLPAGEYLLNVNGGGSQIASEKFTVVR